MSLRTTLSRTLVVALSASAAAVGLAGTSNAAPLDQTFLDRLTNIGITYSNPYATIAHAQAVCRALSLGTPHSRVVDLVRIDYPSLHWDGGADYVVTAEYDVRPNFSKTHSAKSPPASERADCYRPARMTKASMFSS